VSYCTVAEASALIGQTLTETTPVTIDEAEAIIAGIDAEIDVHVAGSGGAEWGAAYLKHVSTHGAAARIARAYWPGASGPGSSSGAAAELAAEYQRQLDYIDKGTGTSSGADAVAHGFADASGVASTSHWTREMEF